MFPESNYILAALMLLSSSTQLTIANEARPANSYLFSRYLPEVGRPTYEAKSGNMTVHPVMAGLVGLSSNYPPGGFLTAETTSEKVAKVANHVQLQEEDLRTMQMMVQNAIAQGATQAVLIDYVLNVVINFFDKLVLQPHLDTAEFLRGQALGEGRIDWWNNGIHLEVDYHVPSRNKGVPRTGNDAYGGSASKFWEDVRNGQEALNNSVRSIVMHPNTFNVAAGNPANNIEILQQTGNLFRIRRIIVTGNGNERTSSDVRDTVEVELYGLEATKVDDTNPRQTLNVPFVRPGRLIFLGNPPTNRFDIGSIAVGQGSTPSPTLTNPLGYTHIAPTVEGGGRVGRWGRVFQPELQPWAVVGEAVTNMLPVLENPSQVATAFSEIL